MPKSLSDRVTILETKFEEFKEQNSKEHAEILAKISSLEQKLDLDKTIKRLDDRYAKKDIEVNVNAISTDLANTKTNVTKNTKNINRAFWTSITTLAGFVVSVLFMIFRKVI